MKRRKSRGLTLIELTISAVVLVAVLAGADMMIQSSSGLASSSSAQGVAANRAAHALRAMTDALRRGSLASLRKLDGSTFDDGSSDTGFQIREVTDYRGSPILSSLTSYKISIAAGASEGQVIRSENGLDEILSNGVTSLTVARAGNLFTFTIRTRAGLSDDRGRTTTAVEQATARNP